MPLEKIIDVTLYWPVAIVGTFHVNDRFSPGDNSTWVLSKSRSVRSAPGKAGGRLTLTFNVAFIGTLPKFVTVATIASDSPLSTRMAVGCVATPMSLIVEIRYFATNESSDGLGSG